jgi:hypothetical protein
LKTYQTCAEEGADMSAPIGNGKEKIASAVNAMNNCHVWNKKACHSSKIGFCNSGIRWLTTEITL